MPHSHRTKNHGFRNFIGIVVFMLCVGLFLVYISRPELDNYASRCDSLSGFGNAVTCGYVRLGYGHVSPDPKFWVVLIVGVIVVRITGKLINRQYGSE